MNVHKLNKSAIIYTIILALIVWFSIALQFIISTPAYLHNGRTFGGAIVQIFSFFTILSNILAGLCLFAILLKSTSILLKFFTNNSLITATALYITIVGLVYNTVLRGLWLPKGLFRVADELTHAFNPLAFVIFWLFFVPKEKLIISQGLKWLWFPFLYLIYVLIRGSLYHLYPYPFLDVDKLGYQKVIINSTFVMIAFLVFGSALFFLNNSISSKSAASNNSGDLTSR
jgi:hypothetical protein